MKVNREKFLAAALLLSTATGCGKLGFKGKETAQAAPEVASAQIANDPSVAPAAEADPAKPATGAAMNIPRNTKAKVGVGMAKDVIGPGKEVIAPNNEVIAPANENVIAPANENVIAPANENLPNNVKLPHGQQVAPGRRPRGVH